MKLYTIEVTFSDFTFGIEQYETDSPQEAIKLFFAKAECLNEYDRNTMLEIMDKRLSSNDALIHVANKLKGVWLINVGPDFPNDQREGLNFIYGGKVIQTDPYAPSRQ